MASSFTKLKFLPTGKAIKVPVQMLKIFFTTEKLKLKHLIPRGNYGAS